MEPPPTFTTISLQLSKFTAAAAAHLRCPAPPTQLPMEKETHDFMTVDSFSQLPFIRPSSLKEKSIRLFGKEFVGGNSSSVIIADESDSTHTPAPVQEESKEITGESNRKFRCHFCYRNFPTSQALGGHQNAHKRERQHVKRAHLQSAMFHGSVMEAQMYGPMNYHRLTAQITPYYHHQQQQPPPSWATTYNSYTPTSIPKYSSRFYGGINSTYSCHQTPINGSPLATWSFSSPTILNSSLKPSRTETQIPIPYPYDQQKSRVQDQVSLDLSL